jgi:hypothetical protein
MELANPPPTTLIQLIGTPADSPRGTARERTNVSAPPPKPNGITNVIVLDGNPLTFGICCPTAVSDIMKTENNKIIDMDIILDFPFLKYLLIFNSLLALFSPINKG